MSAEAITAMSAAANFVIDQWEAKCAHLETRIAELEDLLSKTDNALIQEVDRLRSQALRDAEQAAAALEQAQGERDTVRQKRADEHDQHQRDYDRARADLAAMTAERDRYKWAAEQASEFYFECRDEDEKRARGCVNDDGSVSNYYWVWELEEVLARYQPAEEEMP